MKESLDLRVLFIEDDVVARESILMVLEELFTSIIVAVDGEDGLEKFQNNEIDLIITDLSMPRLNGMEFIEEIRKTDKDIYIIVLSAYTEHEYIIRGIGLGIDGYLLKPFDMEQFLSVMSNMIKNIQLKNELYEVKERMELALIGSNDGIWDWNILDNTVYFSPRWKEMLGYRDDELPNEVKTWSDRIYPDDAPDTWEDIYKNVNGETEYYENVHRLKHKDGHWVWIQDRGKIQCNKSGKAIRMIGTHTDITKEKELHLKFVHQAQIIEQIHDSVISTDLKGIITSWNNSSKYLFGYTVNEAIGQHIRMLYLEEDFESLDKNIETLKEKGKWHSEVRLLTKSKDIVEVDLSLSLLRNEKGFTIGMIGYSKDITREK